MDQRQAGAEREKAKAWWKGLDDTQRGELGDALVLGAFDWRDWFDAKPSVEFMRALEYERTLWEV